MPLVPLEPSEAPVPGQVFLVTRWCSPPPSPSPSTPSSTSASPTVLHTYSPESRPWIAVICSLDMLSTEVWNGRPQGPTAFLDVHDLSIPGHNPCKGISHGQRLWAVFLYGKGMVRWVKKDQLFRFRFYDPYVFVGVGPEEKRQFHQLFNVVKAMADVFRDKEKRLLFWRVRIRQADAEDDVRVVMENMRRQRGRQQAKPVRLPVDPFRDDERDELQEVLESARSKSRGKGREMAALGRMRNHFEEDDRLNHVWNSLKAPKSRRGNIQDEDDNNWDADVDGEADQSLEDDGLISDEDLLTTSYRRDRQDHESSSYDNTPDTDSDSEDDTLSQPDEEDEDLNCQRLDLEVEKNLIAEGEAKVAALEASIKAQKRKIREDEERLEELAKNKKKRAAAGRVKPVHSDANLFGDKQMGQLPRREKNQDRSPTPHGTSNYIDKSLKVELEDWEIVNPHLVRHVSSQVQRVRRLPGDGDVVIKIEDD